MATGSSRWTKDDLRAAVELGVVASFGAIAGWLSGFGALVGALATLTFFWIALAVACLFEFWRGR